MSAIPDWLHAAQAEGLLPPQTLADTETHRPWPVLLLTAVGAWLAAVPLLLVLGLLLSDFGRHSGGLVVMGLIALVAAITLLRARDLPLFLEQMGLPLLMAGMGLLGVGWTWDAQWRGAVAGLCAATVLSAVLIPKAWLRSLLGLAAAALLSAALCRLDPFDALSWGLTPWWTVHGVMALGLAAWVWQEGVLAAGRPAPALAAVEALGAGWMVAVLCSLAALAGQTFLLGATVGGQAANGLAEGLVGAAGAGWVSVEAAGSAALAAGSALWLARSWPALRQPWCGGVALVAVGLAWFMPSLGGVLAVAVACLVTGRWRLAGLAAAAAVWVLGAFYYQLAWPLAHKAAVLALAGALLGGVAWWGRAEAAPKVPAPGPAAPASAPGPAWRRWGVLISAALVLVAANVGIVQKERLIVSGQVLLVPLQPSDPRSLMQGDYMTLNFLPRWNAKLPDQTTEETALQFEQPRAVFSVDERGVASYIGPDTGATLPPHHLVVSLVPKAGRWVLVTDAFFFKEGEATRWAPARFGEFRVSPQGQALLVGLRGADLQPL